MLSTRIAHRTAPRPIDVPPPPPLSLFVSFPLSLSLQVRKADTGRMVQVQLVRVPKDSMANMVRLFEMLTQIKQVCMCVCVCM